mmetsp:Transcript_65808/g.207876  ORF Transcript_65808/g.207876 Transcript_65808/m.207876 type:complete len:366 (-) Transcript_65808:23-1120(-)
MEPSGRTPGRHGAAPAVGQGEVLTPHSPQTPKPLGQASAHRPKRAPTGESPKFSTPKDARAFDPASPASTTDTWSGRSTPTVTAQGSGGAAASGPSARGSSGSLSPLPSAGSSVSARSAGTGSAGSGGRPPVGGRRASGAGAAAAETALYDVLTLRQWFNGMDTDHSGSVTKQEWLDFLRCNPQLRRLMVHGSAATNPVVRDRFSEESMEVLRQEAKEMRRFMRILRELDTDRNGTLEFEEFVEFFRRSGNLIEYGAEAHPRARMAVILGWMHADPTMIDEALIQEFEQLVKWNMQGEQRRCLEEDVIQTVSPLSPAAKRMQTRMQNSRSADSTPRRHAARSETPRGRRRANDFSSVGSRLLGLA